MDNRARDLIDSLGGYRTVARRIGKRSTTVHTQMQTGTLPASWFDAICLLAAEAGVPEPSREVFSFIALTEPGEATA